MSFQWLVPPLRINKSEFQLETLWTILFESLWGLIVLIHSALWRIDCINLKAPQLDKLLPLYMPAIAYYQELFFFQLPH